MSVSIQQPLKSASSPLDSELGVEVHKPDTAPPCMEFSVWWAQLQHTFTLHRLTFDLLYSPEPANLFCLPLSFSLYFRLDAPWFASTRQKMCMCMLLHYSDNPGTLLPCHSFTSKTPALYVKVTVNYIYVLSAREKCPLT